MKIATQYVENWRRIRLLSEPIFLKIRIWDNCIFVCFLRFFAYKMDIFWDNDPNLLYVMHFKCTYHAIKIYVKIFSFSRLIVKMVSISVGIFSKTFFGRLFLGQFLSDLKKLGTILIGEAISLIWAPTMSIWDIIKKYDFWGLTRDQGPL